MILCCLDHILLTVVAYESTLFSDMPSPLVHGIHDVDQVVTVGIKCDDVDQLVTMWLKIYLM